MAALDILKEVLPFIGTALGGPLGAGIATALASKIGVPPEAVTETLQTMISTPEGLQRAQQLEKETKVTLAQLGYDNVQKLAELEVRAVEAVNETMRAETTAEHWMQYSWRPFNGFLFGITIFGCYFVLPLCKIPAPVIPESVWLAWGGVLGIASFFRGKMQADPAIPTATKLSTLSSSTAVVTSSSSANKPTILTNVGE